VARRLEGEEARLEMERVFRFQFEFLDDVMNGDVWHLVRTKDFPTHWPAKTLHQRLYSAAYYRKGRLRFWRVDEDTYGVQFYEPLPATKAPTLEP